MSKRPLLACLVGAALLPAGGFSPVWAKPPDLPAACQVDCPSPDPAGMTSEEPPLAPPAGGSAYEAIDTFSPWLCQLLRTCSDSLKHSFESAGCDMLSRPGPGQEGEAETDGPRKHGTHPPGALSLEDVARLAQQGVSDEIIIRQIRSTGAVYYLSGINTGFLKRCGVSDAVVAAMQETEDRSPRPTPPPPDRGWPDWRTYGTPSKFTCPYLRQQEAKRKTMPAGDPEQPDDVLTLLNKLGQASKLYAEAETCRRDGQMEEARRDYEQVRKLCPGSRYDLLAGDRPQQLHAKIPVPSSEAGAEEEDAVPEQPMKESRAAGASVEGRLTALLEECQRAYTGGRFAEAHDLADKALKLDPQGVASHPLVYKTHLLTLLREKNDIILRPTRPANRPAVADLERVLTDEEGLVNLPLILQTEEAGPAEEQEEGVNSSAPADREMPTFFVEPPERNLVLAEDSDQGGKEAKEP